VPTKADPDFTELPEAHYSENGVRYLHALFISEPEDTPDATGVTFVIAPTALVTVRYHPVETFDLFSQKLCKGVCGDARQQRGLARLLYDQACRSMRRGPASSPAQVREGMWTIVAHLNVQV